MRGVTRMLAGPELGALRRAWCAVASDLDLDGRTDLVAPDAEAGVLRMWLSGRPPPSR